ncbi:hypothetical protein TanjilG_22779 [Lupinus angustifolius]|uniref:Zinc-finger domain-containing protein n=1 Tax=Lupinus angustifolius TaxID=3871 RepID=A0A4P1RIJ4_LUPAN|nr:PREDICTED: cell division cycle-associated protein 7-like [Lupinus angustifolius]OIW10972.1 hypothetical protein TanjilG_22779 [Lupinus angustifolius]
MAATMKKRGRAANESLSIPNYHEHTNNMSDYELSREQRIRENRERMGKLGIMDLSLNLKVQTKTPIPQKRSRYNPKTPPSLPPRRSSRLQNASPVSYCELPQKKDEHENLKNRKILIEAGSKPEVYTEEHEKLLGNTEKSWTLFVDGCGKDGKRIYDSCHGKTCHQCRQKTLGYRTRCSQCNMVQGQFCGDCLYMRYGEHVLEALQNPTWLCPVCRGICNCSLCRQAKGWAPTGALYKKISASGYKSVAHYLIQTRRSEIDVKENEDAAVNPVSAKRSLPFSDVEINGSLDVNENHQGPSKPLTETGSDGEVSAKRSLLFSEVQDQPEKVECSDTIKPLQHENVECSDTMKPVAPSPAPNSDSIAGRLRSRVKKTL